MNRKKFVQSWGRKIFFGISYPLSLLLGIIYFRSYLFPQSGYDWPYFITTYFGHFGVLNALVYFLLYVPVVFLMPSYYVSRLWSLLLILLLNGFILLDGISFSSYQHHLYSFLSTIFLKTGPAPLLGSEMVQILCGVLLFTLAILIWMKGNSTWRYMQGRFSNPVSNWYLVVIVVLFVTGKFIYYSKPIDPRLAELFPFNKSFKNQELVNSDNRRFYYPKKDLNCKGKASPSIILLVLENWQKDQLNVEMMPKTFHMLEHATVFEKHHSVSENAQDGVFSLLYSLPSSYKSLSFQKGPAFFTEAQKRKYEVVQLESLENFHSWLNNRSGEEVSPFFLSMLLKDSVIKSDSLIDEMIIKLEEQDLLRNTIVVLTAATAGKNEKFMPLLLFKADRKSRVVSHDTSPYDVLPSFMKEYWGCENVFQVASSGEPLEKNERNYLIKSKADGFAVLDFKTENVINIENNQFSSDVTPDEYPLIFSALKEMNRFTRP